MLSKYDDFNFWRNSVPSKCSWFFRSLSKTASRIKPFCRIIYVNLESTSFIWNPWCFKIPIALKPTILNMNVYVDHLSISTVVNGDRLE